MSPSKTGLLSVRGCGLKSRYYAGPVRLALTNANGKKAKKKENSNKQPYKFRALKSSE